MAQPTSFPDPPFKSPMFDGKGNFTWPWAQWLQAVTSNLRAPVTVLAAGASFPSNSPGQPGQIATDGTNEYLCTAVNTWKKLVLIPY